MTKEEIEKLYPEFTTWWKKKYHFLCTPDYLSQLVLWYEFLETEKKLDSGQKVGVLKKRSTLGKR